MLNDLSKDNKNLMLMLNKRMENEKKLASRVISYKDVEENIPTKEEQKYVCKKIEDKDYTVIPFLTREEAGLDEDFIKNHFNLQCSFYVLNSEGECDQYYADGVLYSDKAFVKADYNNDGKDDFLLSLFSLKSKYVKSYPYIYFSEMKPNNDGKFLITRLSKKIEDIDYYKVIDKVGPLENCMHLNNGKYEFKVNTNIYKDKCYYSKRYNELNKFEGVFSTDGTEKIIKIDNTNYIVRIYNASERRSKIIKNNFIINGESCSDYKGYCDKHNVIKKIILIKIVNGREINYEINCEKNMILK
ncbi:MAG: hypothetical protein BWY78_00611 [Alphaproteobacteria bacterium ADurb.Bin438]|nr:MAG: hypothetical protein BWY78_00611 [Alphaproteobacteria bacterium ADurb.Bin438]